MTRAYMRDIMAAAVVAVRADASYRDLAALLRAHRVSGFPVVIGDGKVVGVVCPNQIC